MIDMQCGQAARAQLQIIQQEHGVGAAGERDQYREIGIKQCVLLTKVVQTCNQRLYALRWLGWGRYRKHLVCLYLFFVLQLRC